jgi:POT family proton-dependent oligopeptide transporter
MCSTILGFFDAEGLTSLNVFTLAYLVITFGVSISDGLSIMTKLSPKRLSGMMNVVLASAYGRYAAAWLLGAGMSSPEEHFYKVTGIYTEGYYQLAIYALIAGLLLIVVSPKKIRKSNKY